MIYVFLANGFEEIEAFTVIDVLRRANCDVKTVGVSSDTIIGAHNIPVICDIKEKDITYNDLEAIVLPGGMPGASNLEKSDIVKSCISYCYKNNLYIASICAAPIILGKMGLLNGKTVTCYPGFEKYLQNSIESKDNLCVDKNIITAKGPGVSLLFAFKILELLFDKDTSNKIKDSMQCIL